MFWKIIPTSFEWWKENKFICWKIKVESAFNMTNKIMIGCRFFIPMVSDNRILFDTQGSGAGEMLISQDEDLWSVMYRKARFPAKFQNVPTNRKMPIFLGRIFSNSTFFHREHCQFLNFCTVMYRVFFSKFLMGGLKIFGPRRSPTGTKSDGGTCEKTRLKPKLPT